MHPGKARSVGAVSEADPVKGPGPIRIVPIPDVGCCVGMLLPNGRGFVKLSVYGSDSENRGGSQLGSSHVLPTRERHTPRRTNICIVLLSRHTLPFQWDDSFYSAVVAFGFAGKASPLEMVRGTTDRNSEATSSDVSAEPAWPFGGHSFSRCGV